MLNIKKREIFRKDDRMIGTWRMMPKERYKDVGVALMWAGRALKKRKDVHCYVISHVAKTWNRWQMMDPGDNDDRYLFVFFPLHKYLLTKKENSSMVGFVFNFYGIILKLFWNYFNVLMSMPLNFPICWTYFHVMMCIFFMPPTAMSHFLVKSAGSSSYYLELIRRLLCQSQPLDVMFDLINEAEATLVNQEMLLPGFYLFITDITHPLHWQKHALHISPFTLTYLPIQITTL